MTNPFLQQIQYVAQQHPLIEQTLCLRLHGQKTLLRTNSSLLIKALKDYFPKSLQTSDKTEISTEIHALQDLSLLKLGADWQHWPRPKNKTGRKDAILDQQTEQGNYRLLFKVKTGMVYWQHNLPQPLLAIGDIEKHPNQIINFILTQALNRHVREGWQLGHCSALKLKTKTLAFSGLSGGGKSTLMLHFMRAGFGFISNDRVLLKKQQQDVMLRGIPKHPRINPGTIVHNPALSDLITEAERTAFLAMPDETLRQLEQKYDADVEQLYGSGSYVSESKLDALVVLNWSSQSDQTTLVSETTLNQQPELLAAIVKSPGPFYADAENNFLPASLAIEDKLNQQAYLDEIGDIPCYQITGRIDFQSAIQQLTELLNL